jgi:exonuclease VII small subunit
MLVRKKTHEAKLAALEEYVKALEDGQAKLRERVAELERDLRGCLEHRDKLAKRSQALARRLPGETHTLYRALGAACRDGFPPNSVDPSAPVYSHEQIADRVRPIVRQLQEAGEVF